MGICVNDFLIFLLGVLDFLVGGLMSSTFRRVGFNLNLIDYHYVHVDALQQNNTPSA